MLCVLAVVLLADTFNMQAVWLDKRYLGLSLSFVRRAPWDKLTHAAGIALLVVLTARAWRASFGEGGRRDPTWWVAGAVVAFCGASEWFQARTLPGHGAIPHFAADLCGAAIGVIVATVTRLQRARRSEQRRRAEVIAQLRGQG